jgi:hypothetical protein
VTAFSSPVEPKRPAGSAGKAVCLGRRPALRAECDREWRRRWPVAGWFRLPEGCQVDGQDLLQGTLLQGLGFDVACPPRPSHPGTRESPSGSLVLRHSSTGTRGGGGEVGVKSVYSLDGAPLAVRPFWPWMRQGQSGKRRRVRDPAGDNQRYFFPALSSARFGGLAIRPNSRIWLLPGGNRVPVPISPNPERTYSTDGSGFQFKAATLERVVKPALGVFHGWDGLAKGAGVARHTPDVCGEGRLRPHLPEGDFRGVWADLPHIPAAILKEVKRPGAL